MTDKHDGLVATGTYHSPAHGSQVMHARRRSQAPGHPDEPTWGEWTFDRNGFDNANDLADHGTDIAFIRRPEGGVDEYWFCEVGWSALDEDPQHPETDLYLCTFSMCSVPVPVPEADVSSAGPLLVASGSRLRLRLPALQGLEGVLRVYDVSGRAVMTRSVAADEGSVWLDPYASGVYFVDLRTATNRWMGRGVVIR